MDIYDELHRAYLLFQDRFGGIIYPMPALKELKLRPGQKDGSFMCYDSERNWIYLSPQVERRPQAYRILQLVHELTHAWVAQSNPEFRNEKVYGLLQGSPDEREEGLVKWVLNEGLATWTALDSLAMTPDPVLKRQAFDSDRAYARHIRGYLQGDPFPQLARQHNTTHAGKLLAHHFREDSTGIRALPYAFGYFATESLLTEFNPFNLVETPPKNFEELFCREEYRKRIVKESA